MSYDIVAVVPFHKRIEVSRIFWSNIKNLQDQGIKLGVVAVVSDDENKELAECYTDHVVEFPNSPVGKKWNHGIRYSKKIKYNLLMIVGSDDIFSSQYIRNYLSLFKNKSIEYAGHLDAVALNLYTGRLRYFKGYGVRGRVGETVGSGRVIRKYVVAKMGYRLFGPKNRGLDASMTKNIRRHNVSCYKLRGGISYSRIGLKSKTSIGKMFGRFNIPLKMKYMNRHYSKETLQLIKDFKNG